MLDPFSAARTVCFLASVGLILPGCGGGMGEGSDPHDLSGYAQPSCGPADGPAVEIYLTQTPALLTDTRAWLDSVARLSVPRPDSVVRTDTIASNEPILRVLVWTSATRLRGRRFPLSPDATWGDVSWCALRGGCTPVHEGWIRFDDAEGRDLAGRYELRASDGDDRAGSFRARWVERTFLCG